MPGQDGEYKGSTAISFSSDVLAKLRSGHEAIVAVSRTDSERQDTGDGRLKRVEPHPVPFPVVFKGRRANLPAVHAKIVSTIFIGKWTVKIMSSLRESPIAMGNCDVASETSRNECSRERFAIWNRQD
jgi:hypothetical protein